MSQHGFIVTDAIKRPLDNTMKGCCGAHTDTWYANNVLQSATNVLLGHCVY